MAIQRCPRCRLVNPAHAMTCDCGYSFFTGEVGAPPPGVPVRPPSEVGDFAGRLAMRLVIRVAVGLVFLFFVVAVNHCRQ